MINFRYVLFYSNRSQRYKLAKVKADNFNPKNPEVLWVFSHEKLSLAKRILKNMNAASASQYAEMQIAS